MSEGAFVSIIIIRYFFHQPIVVDLNSFWIVSYFSYERRKPTLIFLAHENFLLTLPFFEPDVFLELKGLLSLFFGDLLELLEVINTHFLINIHSS